MIDHLRETALCDHLVDWILTEQKHVVDRPYGFEEGRVMDQNGGGEYERQERLDDLKGNWVRSSFSVCRCDGVGYEVGKGIWR